MVVRCTGHRAVDLTGSGGGGGGRGSGGLGSESGWWTAGLTSVQVPSSGQVELGVMSPGPWEQMQHQDCASLV